MKFIIKSKPSENFNLFEKQIFSQNKMQQEKTNTIIGTGLADHVAKSVSTIKTTGVKTRKQKERESQQSRISQSEDEQVNAATVDSEKVVEPVAANPEPEAVMEPETV